MRIGLLARTRTKLVELVAVAAAIAALPVASRGQSPYGADARSGRPVSGGPMQALYMAPGTPAMGGRQSSYVDAYGNPIIVPAGYCEQCGGCGDGCGCVRRLQRWMQLRPRAMRRRRLQRLHADGCGGTDPPIGYDLMNDVGMEGDLVDQRGPHYFDIRAEAVYLHRDKTFDQDIDFTSLNVGNTVVLSTQPVGFRRRNRASASSAVTTFARCRSSNLATRAFSAGKIRPRLRTRRTTCFRCFRGLLRAPACLASSPAGVNLPGGPNPESERASKHTHLD